MHPRMWLAFLATWAHGWFLFNSLSTKISFSRAALLYLIPQSVYITRIFLKCRIRHLVLLSFSCRWKVKFLGMGHWLQHQLPLAGNAPLHKTAFSVVTLHTVPQCNLTFWSICLPRKKWLFYVLSAPTDKYVTLLFLAMPLSVHHFKKQQLFCCQNCLVSIEIWCPLIVNAEINVIRNFARKAVKRAAYAVKGIPYGFTLKILLLFLIHALSSWEQCYHASLWKGIGDSAENNV